jgi:hypothetical protein
VTKKSEQDFEAAFDKIIAPRIGNGRPSAETIETEFTAWSHIMARASPSRPADNAATFALALAGLVVADATARITRLEQKIAALEARGMDFAYRGVWKSGVVFRKDNFCTHAGSLWISLLDNALRPGDGGAWQLVAKGGRGAK